MNTAAGEHTVGKRRTQKKLPTKKDSTLYSSRILPLQKTFGLLQTQMKKTEKEYSERCAQLNRKGRVWKK